MAEITWKNVQAPDFSGSGRLYESGANMISSGLDRIVGTGDLFKQVAEENFQTQRDMNTSAIIGALAGAGNTAEFDQVMQQMGTPEQLSKKFGNNIDISKIVNSLGELKNQVQIREENQLKLDDAIRSEATRESVNEINSLLASGNTKEAASRFNTLAPALSRTDSERLSNSIAVNRDREISRALSASASAASQSLAREKFEFDKQMTIAGYTLQQNKLNTEQAKDKNFNEAHNLVTETLLRKSVLGQLSPDEAIKQANIIGKELNLSAEQIDSLSSTGTNIIKQVNEVPEPILFEAKNKVDSAYEPEDLFLKQESDLSASLKTKDPVIAAVTTPVEFKSINEGVNNLMASSGVRDEDEADELRKALTSKLRQLTDEGVPLPIAAAGLQQTMIGKKSSMWNPFTSDTEVINKDKLNEVTEALSRKYNDPDTRKILDLYSQREDKLNQYNAMIEQAKSVQTGDLGIQLKRNSKAEAHVNPNILKVRQEIEELNKKIGVSNSALTK